MNLGVSIVICCHNSTARLEETLGRLALQQTDAATEWEVIVVDNASTDDTAAFAVAQCPEALKQKLRVVSEPAPGLSHARIRGVHSARHEIVSFIDDDNWICATWVQTVSEIFTRDPRVGAVGGPSEAVCECTPPTWFEAIKGYYAIGVQHAASGDVTDAHGTLLWGAGLCIRRAAFLRLLDQGFEFLLGGRKGDLLSSGEDTEICFALRAAGWRFRYDERLHLFHFVPASRLNWNYTRKLFRAMGDASVLFDIYLIALRHHPFDRRSGSASWHYQIGKAIKDIALLLLTDPVGCLAPHEGSSGELRRIALCARLRALVGSRRRFEESIARIRLSKWQTDSPPKLLNDYISRNC